MCNWLCFQWQLASPWHHWHQNVRNCRCSLLKISWPPAQQAASSRGLTVSFQSENIITIMIKFMACHLPSDRVQKKYAAILHGNMRQLSGKQKNWIIGKFLQLTKLIIKPFECTDQRSNKKHFKVLPTINLQISSLIECTSFLPTFCLIFLEY